MEELPRLFATYVDELKLVGPTRFATRISCPMMLVRAIDLGDDDDDPAFATKVNLREELGRAERTSDRPSDRPRDAARVGPGHVLRVEKREGAAYPDRIGIGRAPNVDVRIPVANVSKYHAFVSRDGAAFTLTDAGSSNGTSVRGVPLEPRVPVVLADMYEIGFGTCSVRFYTPEGFVRFVTSRLR